MGSNLDRFGGVATIGRGGRDNPDSDEFWNAAAPVDDSRRIEGHGRAASNLRWFAVKSLPRKEALAHQNLRNQKFEVCCPLIVATRRSKTPKKLPTQVLAPFFPGYLFVRLDLGVGRWRSINGTLGVQRLVQFSMEPSPVPAGLVEALLARMADNGVLQFRERLTVGQTVKVVGGAFDGLIGTLESLEPEGRVAVLMDLMSSKVRIVMPEGIVTSAA